MSLFSALSSAANTLSVYEQALSVTQNNVSNSSTAGYAVQTPTFEALADEPGTGESGGVAAGVTEDSRDQFAESSVQSDNSQLGQFQQQVESLTSLQNNFGVSGTTGIAAALSGLFTAFSDWSTTPNNTTLQGSVLTGAQDVASAFQQTAQQVSSLGTQTDTSLQTDVAKINQLTSQLAGYNQQIISGDTNDPGLSANVYSTLQTLSQYVNFTSYVSSDGAVNVMLGNGQTSVVQGATAQPISVEISVPTTPTPTNPLGPPTATIKDSNGNDITSQISGGELSGLLNVRNQVLPAIQGDSTQTGSLNQLAKAFADRVNGLLTAGQVSAGPPVVNGSALFTYDTTNSTNIANSLSVSSSITTSQLAASDGTTSNGTALALANLSNSSAAADQINGQTYTEFFGSIGSAVGSQLDTAQSGETEAQDSLQQSEALRTQVSGVDLNQQATQIIQFQQGYTAASKLISVIDEMTQTVLNLVSQQQVV